MQTLHPPASLLTLFPPSPDLLLERARHQTDDAMLFEIARADYGQKADEMLDLLRAVRDSNRFPCPIPFLFVEVLELTRNSLPRYSTPTEAGSNGVGNAAYMTCLFACAVLLKMADEPVRGYEDVALEMTLVHGITSAQMLGDEMNGALGQYLAWRFDSGNTHCQRTVHAFTLLTLATRMQSSASAEHAAAEAAKWVLDLDSVAQDPMEYEVADPSHADFGFQCDCWNPVADELRSAALQTSSPELREDLQLCALLGDSPW